MSIVRMVACGYYFEMSHCKEFKDVGVIHELP